MTGKFCTFFLNNIYFGIDVQQVQEVIRPQPMTSVPLAPADICGLINLRGQIVTVINLRQRLEMPQLTKNNGNDELGYNIVVQNDSQIVSLQVDDIGDIVEVAKADFAPTPATLKGKMQHLLQGAYQLDQGFLLVLDTEKVLRVNQ